MNPRRPNSPVRPSRRQLRQMEDRTVIASLTAEIRELRQQQDPYRLPDPAQIPRVLPPRFLDPNIEVPAELQIMASILRILHRRSRSPGLPLSLRETRLQLLRQCRFLAMRENPANPLAAVTPQYLTSVALFQCVNRLDKAREIIAKTLADIAAMTQDVLRVAPTRVDIESHRSQLQMYSSFVDSILELMNYLISTPFALEDLQEPTPNPVVVDLANAEEAHDDAPQNLEAQNP